MKTREQKIEEFLTTQMKPGDAVYIQRVSHKNPDQWTIGTLKSNFIHDEWAVDVKGTEYKRTVLDGEIKRCTLHIGENHFTEDVRYQQYHIDIQQLLTRFGVDTYEGYKIKTGGYIEGVAECTDNPFVLSEAGDRQFYQRPLVWTLEEKQRLIESIYNGVDLGKFAFRSRSFVWCEENSKKYEGIAHKDLVDGKQRVHALLDFVTGKFPDMYGDSWEDLSGLAKLRFKNYNKLSYMELGEQTKDEDTLRVFLTINHSGVPQSEEHLTFVKSLLKK